MRRANMSSFGFNGRKNENWSKSFPMQSCKLINKVIAICPHWLLLLLFLFLNSYHGSCYAGAWKRGRIKMDAFWWSTQFVWLDPSFLWPSFPSLLQPFTLVLYIFFKEKDIYVLCIIFTWYFAQFIYGFKLDSVVVSPTVSLMLIIA